MDSIAEILNALADGSLRPEESAPAIDQVLSRDDFEPADALAALRMKQEEGAISQQVCDLVRARIERGTGAGDAAAIPPAEFEDPDEGHTVFRPIGSMHAEEPGPDAGGPPDLMPRLEDDLAAADPRDEGEAAPPPPDLIPGAGDDVAAAAPSPPGDATEIAAPPPSSIVNKGDVINNRFTLDELLGTGGMGSVYKALDQRKLEAEDRNPYIAIKLLNADFRARPDSMMTLQREARRAQSLAHPNIVRVYDFDRDGENVYLTMEYLVGAPLDETIRAPSYTGAPLVEALPMINQIGEALAFAHEHDVAHCDLKPGNIFLTDRGQIKVIDFGISRPVKKADEAGGDVTRFDPGSIGALTPAYASPELIEDNEAGAPSDIFAFACIVCEIMSGRHPFDRIEATKARDNGLSPRLPEGISRPQGNAIRRALAFDPRQRTPSIREFLDGLNVAPTPGGQKYLAVGAVSAALLVVVGAGLFYVAEYQANSPLGQFANRMLANVMPARAPVQPRVPDPRDTDRKDPRDTGKKDSQDKDGFVPADQIERDLRLTEIRNRDRDAARLQPKTDIVPPAHPAARKLAQIFERMDCAQLTSSITGDRVQVAGFMPAGDVAGLKKQVLRIDGITGFSARTHPISASQCGLLRMVTPFVNRNRLSKSGLKIITRNPDGEFTENENLIIDFRAPVRSSYVYVDYFSLDGGVLHMLPDPNFPNTAVPASHEQALGEDASAGQWTIGPPFGVELIIALATSEPLFSTPREENEQAAEYSAVLRQNLKRLVRKEGSLVVAAFVFLKTSAERR